MRRLDSPLLWIPSSGATTGAIAASVTTVTASATVVVERRASIAAGASSVEAALAATLTRNASIAANVSEAEATLATTLTRLGSIGAITDAVTAALVASAVPMRDGAIDANVSDVVAAAVTVVSHPAGIDANISEATASLSAFVVGKPTSIAAQIEDVTAALTVIVEHKASIDAELMYSVRGMSLAYGEAPLPDETSDRRQTFDYGIVPLVPEELPSYLAEIMPRIAELFTRMELITQHAEPEKVYPGMIVLADGSDWDPGSGAGVYCYYSETWNYIG